MCSAVQLFYCQYSFIPWINLKILFYCWNQRFWLQRIDRIFATLQGDSNRESEEQNIWRTRRRDAAPHHRECRAEELFGYFLNSQFHCLKKYYMKEEKLHSQYIFSFKFKNFYSSGAQQTGNSICNGAVHEQIIALWLRSKGQTRENGYTNSWFFLQLIVSLSFSYSSF